MRVIARRIGLGFLIGGLGAVLLFVGSVQFTNRSNFCTTCHYMQPYYDAWASSTHHNVPCRKCHYEPGYSNVVKGKLRDLNQLVKYWTNAYRRSKPWAEISDASCLRVGCHAKRLLQGRVMFGKVNFDHRPHLLKMRRGEKLRCTSCHSQIVQGKHMTVTQNTCILCHFKLDKEGKNNARCVICHDPPVPVPGEEPPKYDHTRVVKEKLNCERCHGKMVVGDGAVPKERCYACHWDRARLSQYGNTKLLHAKHITEHKIECDLCHLSMQHKSISKEHVIPECQTCHEGFHEAQKDMFTGHGGRGVPDHPNPMFKKGLTCQGCHVFHSDSTGIDFSGETFVASGKSCEPCHGAGYGRLLGIWKESAQRKMDTLHRILTDAARARKRTVSPDLDTLYREALYNYDLVKKARPIHNIVYANLLLDSSYSFLRRFFKIVNPGYRLAKVSTGKPLVPSACVNCHSGIEEINVPIYGLVYSHQRHLVKAGVSCPTCHSNQNRHGELIVQRKDCLNCHHTKAKRTCGYCHTTQETLIKGTLKELPLEDSDVMYQSDVSCRDCHEGPNRSIVKPASKRCGNCHDADYPGIHRQWLADFGRLHRTVDSLLAGAAKLPFSAAREERLEPVRQHIRAIDADGSRGTHNHFEQMRILEADIETLKTTLSTGG